MMIFSRWKIYIALFITSLAIIGCIFYAYFHNKIINPPVATVEILHIERKLPINEVFDPPYEYTTNSGIIRHPHTDGYLVSFHTDMAPSTRFYRTKLHLLEMDKNFKTLYHSQIHQEKFYTFHPQHWSGLSAAQDPRLFEVNGKIFMLYNDSVVSGRREVYIGEIELQNHYMYAKNILHLNYQQGAYRDQKNWSPFIYDDQIYFIYTTNPYVILHWDQRTNSVTKVYAEHGAFGDAWNLGDLRGGTPAIYVKELDAYLTFFHSCLRYREREPKTLKVHQPFSRIYYMGAYLFDAKPPFKILAYTPQPLSYKDQYKKLNVNYHIIFPCGLLEQEDRFLISAGIQDEKTEILSVKKADLYKQFKYIDRGNQKGK